MQPSEIELIPLSESDLPFLQEVRNHELTRPFLHDTRHFSLDEVRQWFFLERPRWWIVRHAGERVGYLRTSDWDEQNRSVKVGGDIHPAHRRRGLAFAAYRTLFSQLREQGWHRVWLEVLPDNATAIRLYHRLGFVREGVKIAAVLRDHAWIDSVVMSLILSATARSVKVVVTYLGRRRGPPRDAREGYDLLNFLVEREQSVDPGCAMDTVIIHNRVQPEPGDPMGDWIARCASYLAQVDGIHTRRGQLRVVTRENMGLSFGGYNHAFSLFGGQYDYWTFVEDDHIMIKDGYQSLAVAQMEADPRIGFVALVGVSEHPHQPRHAHGGVGVSRRPVLQHVKRENPCERHPEGHLPYHYRSDYGHQELLGEIRFTNAIAHLGYQLVNIADEDVCVAWKRTDRRTPRVAPWSDDVDNRRPT